MEGFSPAVAAWFETTFSAPTPAQAAGWPAIQRGEHTLILAPTGSGKTLAAFLAGIDRVMTEPRRVADCTGPRIVYISPLRALAVDVEKNLRAPLVGTALAAERLGVEVAMPTVGLRTGDTPADERRRLIRHPPDILITTPESLYLMMTSAARETLAGVETVIVDEIHAVAATKRGAHLSVTLERLGHRCAVAPQRIGLSATQRPLDEIARFLGGRERVDGVWRDREVTIVDAGVSKDLELRIEVPVEDMGALGEQDDGPVEGPAAAGPQRRSIWPSMHPRLLDLVEDHHSTIVFSNARRLSERLAARLNELAAGSDETSHDSAIGEGAASGAGSSDATFDGESLGGAGLGPAGPIASGAEAIGVGASDGGPVAELVKAHHGSISRERRLQIEDELKRGDLKGIVATSSLELGIDMGAVDLVIQVESPGSVARGLQRVGRAGHQVGAPSRAVFFPTHRADLLETAVVVEQMQAGEIETTRYLRNPIDVLCQQLVAACALDEWSVDELAELVRRSANFAELSDEMFEATLDLLSGRYPSEEFSELRPRLVWDRVGGEVRGRRGAQRLAVTNAGTIPDRGLFGVFLPDGTRVGELDEEMVYESRPGEVFLLGASTWRIEDITFERVVVTPAPGQPGKMPFWHGDGPGRPIELGRAIGAFVRELGTSDERRAIERLTSGPGLDERAARNLIQFLADQRETAGVVPDDRTIVVERFRDEIGDWRICVLTPFGSRVHAPWGIALRSVLRERWDTAVEIMWSDDGIVIRLPEAVEDIDPEDIIVDPDEVRALVVAELPSTALFASRFRECAGRALLLPRRRPDRRTPLWQQRQRAADLLAVAARHPSFPILLEATRECLHDVFDLPSLVELLGDLRSRRVRLVSVDTDTASPFAQSLVYSWIAVAMYEGDAPLAERRAAALTLDAALLSDLLGAEELRQLLDPAVLAEVELELQHLLDGRRARDVDEAADLLRTLGPLGRLDLEARCEFTDGGSVDVAIEELVSTHRAFWGRVAGEERLVAAQDAARFRDAVGVALVPGLPRAFTEPVDDPLLDLTLRYALTHGPFQVSDVARWLGVPSVRIAPVVDHLERVGTLVRGEFRPAGQGVEWVETGVLRRLRRRSLAVLRSEIEPVEGSGLARYQPVWQGVGLPRRGADALGEVIEVLQGAAIPASVLETSVLPDRMADYRPSDLDVLCTSGELVWVGAGAIGSRDGRVRLVFRDMVPVLAELGSDEIPDEPVHRCLLDHLASSGASFWPELHAAAQSAGLDHSESPLLTALWDLVWAGLVTNDSLAPVRAHLAGPARQSGPPARSRGRRGRPRPGRVRRSGPPSAAGRWSLVEPMRHPAPSAAEAAHAKALQLLARYGVVARETALAEGIDGGFAGLYPVLKALEERGTVRRGYFVAGLGAAQFALPGAVDRLRAERDSAELGLDESEVTLLAAVDPAQPYGAVLPWPETSGRPARAAGAQLVSIGGQPAVLLDRSGKSLVAFPAAVDDPRWAGALAAAVRGGRLPDLEITKIDGEPARESGLVEALRGAGFADGYRGLTMRRR